jgi:hypothetical protein
MGLLDSVPDPHPDSDPWYPYVFGLQDPHPLVTNLDPDPDPAPSLFSSKCLSGLK